MQSAAQDLPTDIAELQAMVSARDADLRVRDLMIEKLKHQLAGMRRHRFGASSETLDQLQLTLEDGEVGQAAEAAAGADREPPSDPEAKGQPKRKPLPAHLPRNEEVLSPDSARTGIGLQIYVEDGYIAIDITGDTLLIQDLVHPLA